MSSIDNVFNSWLGDVCVSVVTLCLVEASVENSVIVISGGVGALGLIIFVDDLDCSCETIIGGFRVDTSILLMTSLLERSTELVCVDDMVTSMDSMDENKCVTKDGVDSLLSTNTGVVDGKLEVIEDVYMTV